MWNMHGVVRNHQEERLLACVFSNELHGPSRQVDDSLRIVVRYRELTFEVDVRSMTVPVWPLVKFVSDVVPGVIHATDSHSLAEMSRHVVFARGFEHGSHRDFVIPPLRSLLRGQHIKNVSVLQPG
jgi:hypothetical protein